MGATEVRIYDKSLKIQLVSVLNDSLLFSRLVTF